MIRIGLAGSGTMGKVHAAAYASIPGAVVAGVTDRDVEGAAVFAASIGARAYPDLQSMAESGDLDAVDCCLPTPLHRSTAELAAAHHLHLICEKPLALTVEDATAMIAAARAAGVHLLVGQVVRFFPQYRRLSEALRDGSIGDAVSLTMLRQGFYPGGSDGWYQDDAQSGGVLLDLMVHDFDWALHHLGPAERVYARLVRRYQPRPFAQGMATVRHRSGAISLITGTWGHPGPFTTMVELAGKGGLLRYHSGESAPITVLSAPAPAHSGSVPSAVGAGTEDPYRTQLAHFVDALAGNVPPLVQPEEALAAVALACAARRSAATGRPEVMEAGR